MMQSLAIWSGEAPKNHRDSLQLSPHIPQSVWSVLYVFVSSPSVLAPFALRTQEAPQGFPSPLPTSSRELSHVSAASESWVLGARSVPVAARGGPSGWTEDRGGRLGFGSFFGEGGWVETLF